jgi:pimeloyl-ACP methyl ester carboxylesterase
MSRFLRAALLGAAAFAVPAALNLVISRQRRELVNTLPGDSCEYAWPFGSIAYQARGEGRPLVLIHGVGAGESSYEWRHNFEALSEQYRVFAFDLPGFGKSARRNITYTADLYVTALIDFLRDVVKEPAFVVAGSLSGAFAVQAVAMRPELIERLVLVCPTGLEQLRQRVPVASQTAYGIFSLPAIGTMVYNGITSYKYIESYLRENIYVDPVRVTPALVEHYYQYAHQPNAQYVLRSFLAGLLNCDITDAYPRLTQPLLVCWGRHARETPVENAQRFLTDNSNARLRIFENSRLLPNDEEWEDFNAAVLMFLSANSDTIKVA